jgi:transposase, IS5 family
VRAELPSRRRLAGARAKPQRLTSSVLRPPPSPPTAAPPGGQVVLHGHGAARQPYDGHTLGAIIEATERLTGRAIARSSALVSTRDTAATILSIRAASSSPDRSAGLRCHQAQTATSLRRRSCNRTPQDRWSPRSLLSQVKGRDGDAANAILSAAGYNLRLVLVWLRALWPLILVAFLQACPTQTELKSAS